MTNIVTLCKPFRREMLSTRGTTVSSSHGHADRRTNTLAILEKDKDGRQEDRRYNNHSLVQSLNGLRFDCRSQIDGFLS